MELSEKTLRWFRGRDGGETRTETAVRLFMRKERALHGKSFPVARAQIPELLREAIREAGLG